MWGGGSAKTSAEKTLRLFETGGKIGANDRTKLGGRKGGVGYTSKKPED